MNKSSIFFIIISVILIIITCHHKVTKKSNMIDQAITSNGKEVVLYEDGHWEYLQTRFDNTMSYDTLYNGFNVRNSGIVINVKDGDTFDIRFFNYIPGFDSIETVRLMGINAPELKKNEHYAVEACEYLSSQLMNQNIVIVLDKFRKRDSFGRILAYVYLSDGICINSDMLKKGFARIYTKSRSEKILEYEALQYAAIESRIGLWSGTKKVLSIIYIYNYELNEYILLANQTKETIDISGWYFSDKGGDRVSIPENTRILPGTLFKFCTGSSECDRLMKYCIKLSTNSIWNNGGESISLYSIDNVLIDNYSY